MFVALIEGERRRAEASLRGGRGGCPGCGQEVVAKSGPHVSAHFAHRAGHADCHWDREPETSWHLAWKALAPLERCEVMKGGCRADVVVRDYAIEFQRKALSAEDVEARERAHGGQVIWVVHAREAVEAGRLRIRYEQTAKGNDTFTWSHPSRWWTGCRAAVVLDLGPVEGVPPWHAAAFGDAALFAVRSAWNDPRVGGWGRVLPAHFLEKSIRDDSEPHDDFTWRLSGRATRVFRDESW